MNARALFHITRRAEWQAALDTGTYRAPSLFTEGFIHLSDESQWRATLSRYFGGQSGLVLLQIDATRLRAQVKYEAAHGESFPHLYGELNVDAVVGVIDLP